MIFRQLKFLSTDPDAVSGRVVSRAATVLIMLVVPGAVLAAPVAAATAEMEICGEDAEDCGECIAAADRTRFRRRGCLPVGTSPQASASDSPVHFSWFAGSDGHRFVHDQMAPIRC